MARNGYPNPGNRLFYVQSDVWNTIQAHNSTLSADSGWATDPHGLTGCLANLANPAGIDWVEEAQTSRDDVLYFMLYWMSVRRYPSPVLVNQGGHWVVVVGYECDVDPTQAAAVTLQQISFHDPEPHNIGTQTTMSASQWYNGPWNGSVIYSGTWLNDYVAVVEPPKPKGAVRVQVMDRTGRELLSDQQAVEHAIRWVRERRLAERPGYQFLAGVAGGDVAPAGALLVQDEPRMDRRHEGPIAYYVVPFGVRGENERGRPTVRVSVLVNAYTGDFEEATVFGRPIHYMTREDALEVAAKVFHVDREQIEHAEATLMFQPSKVSHIRAYPFWRIGFRDRSIYIDQLGEVFGRLELSIPGD
jgi:hypothetical protein